MNMKTTCIHFILLLAICSPVFGACGNGNSPEEMIAYLRNGIDLNERFKLAAIDPEHKGYSSLRTQTESYTDAILLPCMRQAADSLGKTEEPRLAKAVLDVMVSFSNSANEEIPSIVGGIFGKNPDAISKQIEELPSSDRKTAIGLLQFGLANVESEFPQRVIVNRRARLELLSP